MSSSNPIHHLTQIDPESLTAICSACGFTEIRERKYKQKYTAYICATHKREYAAKYRLQRSQALSSRPKSPSLHRLSEINDKKKTAVCSQCGLVRIYVWHSKNGISRWCSNGHRERSKQFIEKRKKANRQMINEYKTQHGCQRCGFSFNPLQLIIHRHNQNGKHQKDWKLLIIPPERLTQELDKHEVLCKSCYRLVHTEQGWKHQIPPKTKNTMLKLPGKLKR